MAIFFISYIKVRDRIPTSKRDKFEKLLMILLLVFLILDVTLLIFEREEISMEINDCIRFYRYFPYFQNDSEFYFINKWCYEYFNDVEIQKMKNSGMAKQRGLFDGDPLENLKRENLTIIK